MITNNCPQPLTLHTGGDYRGMSTDEKPIGREVVNGSTFIEMDTGKVYMYCADTETWHEI